MANVIAIPARTNGLQLIGEMVGSGYRTPPALVRRGDGQTLQLTPLLYAVLEAIDGRRGYAEVAREVSERTGRRVTASDVETLVDRHLRRLGLVLGRDGTAPSLKRASPLTGLRFKLAVTNPILTRRLTAPFAALFQWWVSLPLLLVFGWVSWWLLMERGLASATYHAFAKPDLLLVVVAVTVLSAGFHEFGHAAAARRGGAQPGVMGAGWYLLWPAFYTDVTDTYRLGRVGRIRVDLGGLYFNAIAAVVVTATWWITGWDALLLIVVAQILQMVRQLTPLVRFDGYHVLADVTGVPDLFSRIGPILASFWPTRRHDPRVTQLKWWARLVVTAWVVVVVPVLLVVLLALVLAAPRLIGTAWAGLEREAAQAALHWNATEYVDAIGAVLAMGAITLPVIAMALIFSRVVARFVGALWRRTAGRPIRRAAAGMLVATMAAALAFAWWPNPDRYRPVRPYEGGTLADLATVPLAAIGYASPVEPPPAEGGEMVTVLPRSEPLPTEAEPQLAVVLVPEAAAPASDGSTSAAPATDTIEPGWVFPFNEPLPPEPGDNQALAVNTADGMASYDVAIAMVWVTDQDPVLNVNEAYAFASCSDCVTVSVAFQVVVIVGSAEIVVPQNLSAALNYECFRCITTAIASQLVVTVESLPGVEQQVALADVWTDIERFAASIPTLPLADVITELENYKEQIATILGVAPMTAASASASTLLSVAPTMSPEEFSDTASSSGASTATTSTPEPTASPAPAPTSAAAMPSPTADSEATIPATTEPTSEPTTSSEPSPTPTATPSPTPDPS